MERPVANDTRGWIMTFVSGAACVLGSSVICVDLLIRRFPGKQNFSINENGPFLAGSLSLSFGVMLFSSLYSMLPTSKLYFLEAEYSDQMAGVLMVVWLIFGFLGIQFVTRLLHRFMPSHIVDCDHHHNDPHEFDSTPQSSQHCSTHGLVPRHRLTAIPSTIHEGEDGDEIEIVVSESTPLLVHEHPAGANGLENGHPPDGQATETTTRQAAPERRRTAPELEANSRRPPMSQVQQRLLSFVKDMKSNCDEGGPCYGYSDPCGQECFKHVNSRGRSSASRVSLLRSAAGGLYPGHHRVSFARGRDQESMDSSLVSPSGRPQTAESLENGRRVDDDGDDDCECHSIGSAHTIQDIEAQHHHHVPTNAFLSIGVQTSIAIALHKFPEGFITYATNHANPALGFNVFMALFVHNLSEGYTMALPLYMALNSRVRAMFWAFLLGGLSQPIGAGVAALWFWIAKDQDGFSPNSAIYGCLFAVTAGIMLSVALQLFVESLNLGHNRNLSIFCAFMGMVILGLSGAIFGED